MVSAKLLSIFGLVGIAQGDNFRKQDLVEALQSYTDAASPESLERLEATLSPMYNSLPKDEDGQMEIDVVRYALHRMLVQKHGWYVKGLKPDGKQWNPKSLGANVKSWMETRVRSLMDTSVTLGAEDWVPEHIERVLNARINAGGLNLRELAAVASLLETVAKEEATVRLDKVYELFDYDISEPLQDLQSKQIIDTYMYEYLDPINYHPSSGEEAWARIRRYQERHGSEWPAVNTWLRDVQQNSTNTGEYSTLDHATAVTIVEQIGQQYYHFDVRECKHLKDALILMEGSQSGRVPLKTFYKAGMTKDSMFRFDEKQAYLRDLGALDESDAQNPSVIIPNYVMSAPQCLQASTLYAVCCRNECEDLLTELESKAGESGHASPERIVEVAKGLTSDTVKEPRADLGVSMWNKLQQVAEVNGGQVPLHGRLFAQWMHHAFPRECPFPHETGKTNPMTPEDWLLHTGQESASATEEEMVCHVSGDCSGGKSGGNDGDDDSSPSELFWDTNEELLTKNTKTKKRGGRSAHNGDSSANFRNVAQLTALMGMAGAVLKSAYRMVYSVGTARGKDMSKAEGGWEACCEAFI